MQILHVDSLKLSIIKLFIGVVLTAILIYICSTQSFFLLFSLLVFEVSILIHVFRHNLKQVVKMFFTKLEWGDINVSFLGVYTRASREDQRHLAPRVFIVKIITRLNKSPVFKFRENIYKADNSRAYPLTPNELIQLLELTNIQQHLICGLTDADIKRSQKLFGSQGQLITPSTFRLFLRHCDYQIDWMLLNLNSLLWSKQLSNTYLQALMLALNVAAFIIIFIVAYRDSKRFKEKYGWVNERMFTVIRNTTMILLHTTELLVGDVVYPQGQGEFVFWFGCIQVGENQIVVRQSRRSEQLKTPLRNLKSLGDLQPDKWKKHYITPFSKVQRSLLKESDRFIITEPNSISKHFARWFGKPLGPEFSPPSLSFVQAATNFFYIAVVAQVIFYLLLSWVYQLQLFTASDPLYYGSLSYYLIQAPTLFLLYQLAFLAARRHLPDSDLFSSAVLIEAGLTSNIIINFNRLLQLQFEELLYKNKILGFQTDEFQCSGQTIKNGTSYESLLAVVLYLSMGQFEKERTLLAQAYTHHKESFEYVDGLGDYQDVVHPETSKRWQLLKNIPENQEGLRSWLVLYESKATFVITEMPIDSKAFKRLGDKQDSKKKKTYDTTAKQLQEQGKLVRLMLFRNLKEDRLTQSQRPEGEYTDWEREKLECDYQFGTFLIFDHALLRQTVEAIDDLKSYGEGQLRLSFITSSGRQQIAGFQHIITNVPFIYGCDESQIGRIVTTSMKEQPTLYIGGNDEDHFAFQSADLTIQVSRGQEELLLPADVSIQGLKSVLPILQTGRWMAHLFLGMARLAIVFILFAVLGGLFLDRSVNEFIVPNERNWAVIATGVFIVVPYLTKLFFISSTTDQYIPKSLHFFTWSLKAMLIVGIIFAVMLVLVAQHTGICYKQHHLSFLRGAHPPYICIDLFLLLSSTAAVLLYVIFTDENCLKQRQHWWRLLMVPIWLGLLYLRQVPTILILWAAGGFLVILATKLIVKALAT